MGLIKTYAEGECMVFACRVEELTGWRIVGLRDAGEDRPMHLHYANRRPDGGLVDARGRYPSGLDAFVHRFHGVGTPVWDDFSPMELDDEARAEVDLLLNSAWGEALVEPSERKAATVTAPGSSRTGVRPVG